jgi:hypothetical protein
MAYRMKAEEGDRVAAHTNAPQRADASAVSALQLQALKTPQAVLALQRLAGNRAVVQRLAGNHTDVQRLWNPFADSPEEKARKAEMKRIAALKGYNPDRLPTGKGLFVEGVKPTAVIGSGMGSGLGTGDMGIGSEIIGGASLLDAGLTMYAGSERLGKAKAAGDTAGVSLGTAKLRTGAWGAAGSSTATTEAGVNIGKAVGHHGLAALGTAGGALGVVGGGLTSLQGMWKMYKAAGKLSKLAERGMYTPEGEKWKDRVVNREKWKLGVGGLKVALGALGIAAGALLIASNPVGWAVGIAAAAAGGVWALSKIGNKLKDLRERRNARHELLKKDPDGAKTKSAKELADQVARECSTNAKVAGEMVAALKVGDASAPLRWRAQVDRMDRTIGVATPASLVKPTQEDKKNFDSFSLLGVLNIPPDEAMSDSGHERIEKKLSVAESS